MAPQRRRRRPVRRTKKKATAVGAGGGDAPAGPPPNPRANDIESEVVYMTRTGEREVLNFVTSRYDMAGLLFWGGLIALVGVGIGYYVKVVLPKRKAALEERRKSEYVPEDNTDTKAPGPYIPPDDKDADGGAPDTVTNEGMATAAKWALGIGLGLLALVMLAGVAFAINKHMARRAKATASQPKPAQPVVTGFKTATFEEHAAGLGAAAGVFTAEGIVVPFGGQQRIVRVEKGRGHLLLHLRDLVDSGKWTEIEDKIKKAMGDPVYARDYHLDNEGQNYPDGEEFKVSKVRNMGTIP